MIMWN